MKTSIYDQHDRAFALVQSFAILESGEYVAKINLKFPKDGAGRLTAYVHVIWSAMTRGHATGYGYDKRTAAVDVAIQRLTHSTSCGPTNATIDKMKTAMRNRGGQYFHDSLRDAGFTVIQTL